MVETNDGHTFYDKQFMAGYPRTGHNEAYITFTMFVSDQKCSNGNNAGAHCSSEIFFSTWDGTAWSAPANPSGSSSTLCNLGDTFDEKADPHACNFDQGSIPVVLADGSGPPRRSVAGQPWGGTRERCVQGRRLRKHGRWRNLVGHHGNGSDDRRLHSAVARLALTSPPSRARGGRSNA